MLGKWNVGWGAAAALAGLALGGSIPAQADQPSPTSPTPAGVPTNPLVVPAQLPAEAETVRVLNSPQVQQAIQNVTPLFQQAASQAAGSVAEAQGLIAQDVQALAFSTALPFAGTNGDIALNPYYPAVVTVNDNAHQWFGLDVPTGQFALDNPDVAYRTIAVDPNSSYVIHGRRHTPGPIDVSFSLLDASGATDVNLAYSALQISPDGTYTVTLDGQPANGRANHIQTVPTSDLLIVRNNFNDWATQIGDTLSVSRIAGPPAPPPLGEDQLAAQVAARLAPTAKASLGYATAIPVNQFKRPGAGNATLTTQLNVSGHFLLTDQQALVFTVNTGGAAYFTAPVYDIFSANVDPVHHTSVLNNGEAIPNSDGTFTFVLSPQDPGVYNWLDTGGLHEGLLFFRWQRIPNPSPASGPPALQAQLVNLTDLAATLAADGSRAGGAVTSALRAQQIASREAAFAQHYNDQTARLGLIGLAAHRSPNGTVTVTVTGTISDTGTGDAQFVQVLSARLGGQAVTGSSVPGGVSAGTSGPFSLTFPSVPAGPETLSLSGSFDTGTFADGLRLSVP